jgi:hypothetical protein
MLLPSCPLGPPRESDKGRLSRPHRSTACRDEAAADYDRAFAHVEAFGRAPSSCIQVPDAATGTGLSAEVALATVGLMLLWSL